jgi:hypothetical protein
MHDVDCLRLKQNFAWWVFTGRNLTFLEFKQSAGEAQSSIISTFILNVEHGAGTKQRVRMS